jgi:hypothetical protein
MEPSCIRGPCISPAILNYYVLLSGTGEITHISFQFADGFQLGVGHITQRNVTKRWLRFDVAEQENIRGYRCLFRTITENDDSTKKLVGIQASFDLPFYSLSPVTPGGNGTNIACVEYSSSQQKLLDRP